MSKRSIKFIVFLGLGLFIFYFLLRNVKIDDLKIAFRNFDWRFGLLAFSLYFVMNIFRALRFNFFLENKVGTRGFLKIVFLYNFWNQILPFRSGDLSYLYFVKKSKKVLIGENIASLITARVFDLFVLASFSLAAFYFVLNNNETASSFRNLFFIGIFLIFAIFILVIFFNQGVVKFFDSFLRKIGLLKFRITSFLFEKLKEASQSISSVKSPPRFFHFLKYTIFIWVVDFFFLWALSASAGIILSFWQAIIIVSFLTFAILILPVQTPVNLGTYEGALVLAYLFFGFEKNISVSASLLIHSQNIIFAFILFLFAYLLMNKKWLSY